MKKIFVIMVLGIAFLKVYTQTPTLYVPNALSGIGTSTNSGNMGVRVSNPNTRLHIQEPWAGNMPTATTADQGILISGDATGGALNLGIDGNGTNGLPYYSWIQSRHRNSSTYYNLTLNPAGGNVGIGLYNPTAKFHIQQSNGGWADGIRLSLNNKNWDIVVDNYGDRLLIAKDQSANIISLVNGNLGINAYNPQAKLHIMEQSAGLAPNGPTVNNGILISGNNTGGGLNMGIDGNGELGPFYSWIQSRNRESLNYYNLSLNPFGGNVGIGTTSPNAQLHLASNQNHELKISRVSGLYGFRIFRDASAGRVFFQNTDDSNNWGTRIQIEEGGSAWQNLFLNPSGGNVGIGTTDPGSFKLAVNGKVWAQEVQVALTNPGPDYVFSPNYKLLSLEEIKSYIDQHKHLPEVPSAKEMETNGVNVSEMNMLLLKKIEELTLHVIDLKKELGEHKGCNKN